jgi:hypothetical protein
MMVDGHHHLPGLVCFSGLRKSPGFMEKTAQAGNLFHSEIVGARPLEEAPLGADYEDELIVSMRLDFADLPNQIDDRAPAEIARQFAAGQALK